MTKNKLIELCLKLRKKEITKDTIIKLKELTDEEIDIALNSENKEATIELMSNRVFKTLAKEVQQELIIILNNCDDIYGKAQHIIKVATNQNAISSNHVIELAKAICGAKGIIQSYKASLVACNFNAIASGHVVELVGLLSHCIHIDQLEVAYHAAIDPHITRSGKVTEIVRLIINSKDKESALAIYYKMINMSKDISIQASLSEGKVSQVDFWQTFYAEGEEAIRLLDYFPSEDEIPSKAVITSENIQNKKNR